MTAPDSALVIPPEGGDPRRQALAAVREAERRFLVACNAFGEVGLHPTAVDAAIEEENAAATAMALALDWARQWGLPVQLSRETCREIGRRAITLAVPVPWVPGHERGGAEAWPPRHGASPSRSLP